MVSTAMPVATGPVQFGHTWGTDFSEYAYAVDVDSSGNVYLSGTILGPEIQAFVAKVNIYGIKMWDILLSSPTTSLYLYDSALGPSNSLYIFGQYSATNFYDVGTFYAKIDSSGSLVYQKYLPDLDTPNRICANTAGNGFIIVGDTEYYGTGAVVAVKDDGSVNWAQGAESPEGESPWAAVTDSSGAVYTFLDSCIDSNVAIAKFSKTGRLVKQSVLLTDSESEYTWDLGMGLDGNIYALGANYGNGSLLLASFTPKLDLIWDEYVGTPVGGYEATRLVIASDGSLWAVGYSTWTNGPAVFHMSTSGAVLEATMYEFDIFYGEFDVFDAAKYPSGGIVVAGQSWGFPKSTPVSISGVEVIDIPSPWTADTTVWSKLTLTPVSGDMVSEDIEGMMDNYDTSQGQQAWYGVIDPPPPAFKSSITVKTTQNPYELSFKASASGGKPPYLYEWYFGDGLKASGQQVKHEYAMGGLFQVFLVVTDAKGLVSWATADVSLPAYPVITDVTHYPDPAYVGDTVSFEISAYDPDGGTLSYLWAFGDGASMATTEPIASHSYAAQGIYDSSVTVTDDEGSAVGTSFPVTILPVPQPLGWTALTIPSGHYVNLVGIATPYGRGIHVDSIGSSDYGYQMMGVNDTTHMASATGEIKVSGYFRQFDTLMDYDQPGRRFVRAYALDAYNGTVLASADVLNYTYPVNTWYQNEVVLNGLAPGSPVDIGIGRSDMWLIDWSLTAEWAGVSITPFETNESNIVAEAGPIQYLWGQNMVTLNGSGSYSDAGIVSYVWTWVAGNGTSKMVTGMMPTFPAEWFFSYGNYTITLTVTDSKGNVATDTTNVHFGFRVDYDVPLAAEQCYATSDGYFRLRIENHGMTSFEWTIYDVNLTAPPYDVYNATVTFPGDGIYLSEPFWMLAGGHIQSEYVPTGPVGSYFIVFSYFVPAQIEPPTPPVASFTYTVNDMTVNVDASGSSSQTGIVSYAWDWGDGTTGSGVTASHTYGLNGSLSAIAESGRADKSRVIYEPHPIFGYTYGPDGVTLLYDCHVIVTNVRTGEFVENMSDPQYGAYIVDMTQFMLGYFIGDVLNVTATKGSMFGSAQGLVSSNGYDQIDVILSEST
jgi:PKD repeat protein